MDEAFSADLVSVDIVRPESLHPEIVDKSVFHASLDLSFDLAIGNLEGDKSERDAKPVALQAAELNRLETPLERTDFDLRVPVFAALLPNNLLGIGSLDRTALSGDATFVFVACDAELLGHFPDSLGDVVHCMHRLDVFLPNRHR